MINIIHKNIWAYVIIFFLALFASRGFLFYEELPVTHDLVHHVTKSWFITKTLREEGYIPLWGNYFAAGMPVFQFYPPLTGMILSLLMIIFGFFNSIGIFIFISFLIAGISMFHLAKKMSNHWGGLLSSTVYILNGYFLQNFYVRGALAEAFAISILPLIFLYFNENNKRFLFSGILLALSILSNIPAATIVFQLLFLYSVFMVIKNGKKQIPRFLLIFIIAFALSSFWILPFTCYMTDTSGFIRSTDLHYHRLDLKKLIYREEICSACISPNMVFYFGVFSLLCSIYAFRYWRKNLFPIIVFLLSVVMSSAFLVFPLEEKIVQFPWRYLSLFGFSVAILSKDLGKRLGKFTIILIILIVVDMLPYTVSDEYRKYGGWLTYGENFPETENHTVDDVLNAYEWVSKQNGYFRIHGWNAGSGATMPIFTNKPTLDGPFFESRPIEYQDRYYKFWKNISTKTEFAISRGYKEFGVKYVLVNNDSLDYFLNNGDFDIKENFGRITILENNEFDSMVELVSGNANISILNYSPGKIILKIENPKGKHSIKVKENFWYNWNVDRGVIVNDRPFILLEEDESKSYTLILTYDLNYVDTLGILISTSTLFLLVVYLIFPAKFKKFTKIFSD